MLYVEDGPIVSLKDAVTLITHCTTTLWYLWRMRIAELIRNWPLYDFGPRCLWDETV